jgi:hypothetical protein
LVKVSRLSLENELEVSVQPGPGRARAHHQRVLLPDDRALRQRHVARQLFGDVAADGAVAGNRRIADAVAGQHQAGGGQHEQGFEGSHGWKLPEWQQRLLRAASGRAIVAAGADAVCWLQPRVHTCLRS